MFYIQFKKMFTEKMSESLISSFLVSDVSESLRLLTKNERCERKDITKNVLKKVM